MSQTNIDLGVFQETKLTKIIYTRGSSGYRVLATEALSVHSNGVTVLYRAVEKFSVEALETYGADLARFQLALGNMWWFILGYYLAPYNASTMENIVAAISKRPRGTALLVVRNFNTDLAASEGWEWEKGISAALVEEVLEDMNGRFLPLHTPRLKDVHTWFIHRGGR